jgi:hypothetical protein
MNARSENRSIVMIWPIDDSILANDGMIVAVRGGCGS